MLRFCGPGLSRAALLVFRLGEIEDDALVSLLDGHTKPPAGLRRFCANFSTRWHYNAGRPTPRIQSLYISYTSNRDVPARLARLAYLKATFKERTPAFCRSGPGQGPSAAR